jgi:molybdopterin synthase catalytic subunit
MRVLVTPDAFDPQRALATFSAVRTDAGACASFVGLCRGEGPHGPIAWLELEHYPGFTESEIARIAAQTAATHALLDLLVIHRCGRVTPGAPIVLVAALSAHRTAAFAAVAQLMDYLKTDAPFWKREMRADGLHWIEPTAEDRLRRAAHARDTP